MFVDKKRAKEIFDRLVVAYSTMEYPFNLPEAIPPQTRQNLPPTLMWGSREHALFLFVSCYWMRGGIRSDEAIRRLTRIYLSCPEIFLPEFISDMHDTELPALAAFLRLFRLGFNADEIAGAWKKNFLKIFRKWNSDPRKIFDGISTYEEACDRIQKKKNKNGFHGFQEKMVSMITYFFMDAEIIDRWHFPIPVDFHVLRTVFAHEIVVADPSEANGNGFYTKAVLAAVRELFHSYCVENNVDPLILCNAVWLHSGLMCNQHPGNQTNEGEHEGRKTTLTPVPKWSQAQSRTYDRVCAVCVIRKTCVWCVPSAEYYVAGKLVLRERRESPPQSSLFDILL